MSRFILTVQKQLPRGVLRKGVSELFCKFTGEQPCRSLISIELLCNFTKIALWHGCSPEDLLHIFRAPFPKNTSGRLLMTVLLCDISFLYYHAKISKRILNLDQILWERWNIIQPTNSMTSYHMITLQIKNSIVQFLLRLQSLNMTGHVTTWSCDIEKLHNVIFKKVTTTRLGGNAYQNVRVPLLMLHDLIMLKESKLKPLNLLRRKAPILTGQVIFGYVISW